MILTWKTLPILLVTIALLNPALALAATSNASLNQQIESVRLEREKLLEEQGRLKAELEKVSREGQNLGTAVKSLDASKKKLAADIKVTQSKIKATDLNIRVLENNVAEAEHQIGSNKQAIRDAIRTLSAADDRPLMLDLLASTDFAQTWRDRSELADVSAALDTAVGDLRETKAELTEQKEEKQKVKEDIVSLNKELTGQKQVVEESQKAKERLLAETKNKEALYQQMLADNMAREKQFEQDLFKLESGLNLNIDFTQVPGAQHGILSWPLDKVFVTTYFGAVSGSALRIYASGSHNGVDFRAAQGTPVKAVLGGVISGAGNTDEQRGCGSYGRWILIRHPNGLSSVYGHLSGSAVQVGQGVSAGQVIGYSGGTPGVFGSGYSTGPHLHVGLFATQGVEVRQFVESKGCKQVQVPIADVKAYLDPLAYMPGL